MKKLIITKLLVLNIIFVFAAAPNGYYNSAQGNTGTGLRLALQGIIQSHTTITYDGLWTLYQTSDMNSNGKIWDMYSTCSWTYHNNQCGSYAHVCDCYNREHSVPKSWFNEATPMYSDAFHLYPTDGKVNGYRSNYPFGVCANGTKCDNSPNALGRRGNSTFAGYSGIVFEPDDQYKGDFARTYFYMATCYADKNFTSGEGSAVFSYSNSSNPKCNLTTYAINLFLAWHRQDPVSQKEIDRNDAIYSRQNNRNPFIDHPELAEYIWGNETGNNWYLNFENETVEFAICQNELPYTWRDTIFGADTESGDYILYRNGATITLHLTVNPAYKNTIQATINKGEDYNLYNFNLTNVQNNTTATQYLETKFGCDSIVHLELSVNNTAIQNIDIGKIVIRSTEEGIYLSGAEYGDKITFFTITGIAIYKDIVKSDPIFIPLPQSGIFIVMINQKAIKIVK